jgi:hypothetical protein
MVKTNKRKILISCIIIAMLINFLPTFKNIVKGVNDIRVEVNGTIIYDGMDGEYNEGHGISGVSFDEEYNALILNNASISSIYSSKDLIISLEGTNTITNSVESTRAIESRGNLTIKGSNGSTLTIDSNDIAIEIGADKRLTIGDEENLSNLITVTIEEGNRNINTNDTYIVAGSTYNFTEPGGGHGPGGEPMAPFKLSIDGSLLIDETAEPPIVYATGEGYEIERIEFGYIVNIDTSIIPRLGYVETEGDELLIIAPNGNLSIASNEDWNSLRAFNGKTNFMIGAGGEEFTITFEGGIETEGSVFLGDKKIQIGSISNPIPKGVKSSELNIGYNEVKIYTTGSAILGFDEENKNRTYITNNSIVEIYSANIATENVESIEVSSGGKITINHLNGLGEFTAKSAFWPWKNMLGTTEEELEPGYMHMPESVVCEEGTNIEGKYIMNTGEGRFTLESTGKGVYNISSNIQNEDTIEQDSLVINGRVRVIAANGYKQVAGNRIYRLCYRRRK